MEIQGHIAGGAVVVDGKIPFPEGTHVVIAAQPAPASASSTGFSQQVRLPLVPSSNPGSVKLDGSQIADLLDDDVSP